MIQIYDEAVAERVITIPAKTERPSLRLIVPVSMKRLNDVMEVTITINGVPVMDKITFVVDSEPPHDKEVVAVVSLATCEQPIALLPTIEKQTKDLWVCKSPAEKTAALEPKP